MTLTVEAIYENGVLKLKERLPLMEQQKVQVTVETPPDPSASMEAVTRSYGLLNWTGDWEVARRVAQDPEFGIREAP